MRLVGREVQPGLAREELADELGQAVLRYRAEGRELCRLSLEALQCISENIQQH